MFKKNKKNNSYYIELINNESNTLSNELLVSLRDYIKYNIATEENSVFYFSGDLTKNVYSLGGDLNFFINTINEKKFNNLKDFMLTMVDLLDLGTTYTKKNSLSVTIVNGLCLSGGFTMALAFDVIVADEEAIFGFPTAKQGLFTGIGTFELLRRKIGEEKASEILLSGKTYTAKEMFDFGLIDLITPKETALKKIEKIIENNGLNNMIEQKIKQNKLFQDITRKDFLNSVEICLDRMKLLTNKQLRVMKLMLIKQKRIS